MARQKKPAALMVATGMAKKNPQRMAGREATLQHDGVDIRTLCAPPYFTDEQAQVWDFCRNLIYPGLTGTQDVLLFEQLVFLTWKMRADPLNFKASEHQMLRTLCNDFYLSPAARMKTVGFGKEDDKPKNKFASLRKSA